MRCKCLHCDTEFETWPSEVARGGGKFCGRKCSNEHVQQQSQERHQPNHTCSGCGARFFCSRKRLSKSKSGYIFCGRKCKDEAQRLAGGFADMLPAHYGQSARHRERDVPRELRAPRRSKRYRRNVKLERCEACGFDKHPQVLHVHHIDENHLNDDPSNLQVLCPTCHEVHHYLTGTGRWSSRARGTEPK